MTLVLRASAPPHAHARSRGAREGEPPSVARSLLAGAARDAGVADQLHHHVVVREHLDQVALPWRGVLLEHALRLLRHLLPGDDASACVTPSQSAWCRVSVFARPCSEGCQDETKVLGARVGFRQWRRMVWEHRHTTPSTLPHFMTGGHTRYTETRETHAWGKVHGERVVSSVNGTDLALLALSRRELDLELVALHRKVGRAHWETVVQDVVVAGLRRKDARGHVRAGKS